MPPLMPAEYASAVKPFAPAETPPARVRDTGGPSEVDDLDH